MFSFQTFKDKRYWILLVPFLIILVSIAIFGSTYFSENNYMLPIFMVLFVSLFWVFYHLWKYVDDKKETNKKRKDF